MNKARSRLQSNDAPVEHSKQVDSQSTPKTVTPTPASFPDSFLSKYRRYLPTLIMGVACWLALALIMRQIQPTTIQNTWLPHWYLPVLLLFFLACLFTAAFLLLNTRRAVVTALAFTVILACKLQQIQLTFELLSAILIFFGILELSLSLLSYGFTRSSDSNNTNANFKQKTPHRQRNRVIPTTRHSAR